MNPNQINQLLQTALNSTTNGVLITDNTEPDNPIIYVNSGFEKMTGYETNEIVGHNCRFLQGKDTDRDAVGRLREAIRTGEAIQIELLNYKKDGTPFWNELSVSPVKNERGVVTHFVGVQADITDRKEKEKAERAQLMAESVVDTLREPIVILNEDFTIHSANKAFYNTFQTTPEETIGEHIYELEGGYLNIPALKTLLENILPQRNPFENFDVTHEFPRLGKKALILNARRVDREEDRPEYILLAMEDVTRFEESESARFESERYSRLIIEGLKDLAVITTDPSGKITTWSVGAQRLFGYEEDELIGQNLTVLLSDDEQANEAVQEAMRQAIENGQVQRERWMKRKDGSEIWTLNLLSVMQDKTGNFQGFAVLAYDQTPRKRLEEELARKLEELAARDRAKDEFLAMLGHELRNPLAAMSNAVDVAQMLAIQENLRRPLEIADRQVKHMSQLVGDLLDVARVTQGKIALKEERLALDEIVSTVARTMQRSADVKGLGLTARVEPGVFVLGDALRLEQIVSNLITNAIKYTDKGEVSVELRRQDDKAVLEVSDTGMGIDTQLLPRLFDLFSQADRALARSEGGLGVGLTIVKQLVELHGGTIEASSGGKDQGSSFRATFALDQSAEGTSDSPPATADGDSRTKILVVEDNNDVSEMLQVMLQLWNYNTSLATDGESAIAKAAEESPQIVLLDIGLPKMDGYQVAQKLRERFSPSQMKLISLTGYAQHEDEERAKEAGFDQHLAKPVNLGQLKEILAGLVDELKGGRG